MIWQLTTEAWSLMKKESNHALDVTFHGTVQADPWGPGGALVFRTGDLSLNITPDLYSLSSLSSFSLSSQLRSRHLSAFGKGSLSTWVLETVYQVLAAKGYV